MDGFWVKEILQRKLEQMLTFLRMRQEKTEKGVNLDQETFSCSICLDLLKDPMTIPCGHSYCMKCIQGFWDGEENIHSCPQCRKTFTRRPVLEKSIMLANIMEQLKKTGVQAAPADHCYAGPEDVSCDVCSGRKLKATKSCLICLASYCEKHLQPHLDEAAFKKHKLVEPSKNLQENICSIHDEVMKMFCRTDQKCICYLCSVDEHKDHNTVSAAAERTERQRHLEESQQQIQQRIQDREKEVKLLQQEVEAINYSADQTVKDSQKIFTQMINLIQKRSCDVKQQIRFQQLTEVSRVKDLQEELEQEITELKRRDAELKQLSLTEDHNYFVRKYSSYGCLNKSDNCLPVQSAQLQHFNGGQSAVPQARNKLQEILDEEFKEICQTVTHVDLFVFQEPKTRADFLQYSQQITLDPNTANSYILLSEDNRKATCMAERQCYSSHPERLSVKFQVLSRESLSGHCYWEVKKGFGGISVVLLYKNQNTFKKSFGENKTSWALSIFKRGFVYEHNNIAYSIRAPASSRVGVYLDHRAGVLSFYSISERMTLLHRVQTTFTQPLHVGLKLFGPQQSTAEFVKLD